MKIEMLAITASLKEYSWKQPIVVDKDMTIVVGHTRYMAAMELGMKEVPVVIASDLTKAQVKSYRIADNKVATYSEWDNDLLKLEMDDLKGMDFDLELTGFDEAELMALDIPEFQPATKDEQGKLDELSPIWIKCPHCGKEFDSRE